MSFVVRRPGTCSLLVDAGRPQGLHVGLPRSGPADKASFVVGNALIDNYEPDAMTALELTLHGPSLLCTDSHQVVVFGAGFEVLHLQTSLASRRTIPPGHTFHAEAGDEIQIQGIAHENSLRGYFCVRGGFQSDLVLGSRSGLEPVQRDEILSASTSSRQSSRWIHLEPWDNAPADGIVRLLPGTHLTDSLRSLLTQTRFTVRPESNRMGLRLTSDTVWPHDKTELISAPVVPGTLQLPPGGQPILLGVDAQTIGGYPRLGHAISPDLDTIGQTRPGKSLRFEFVDLEEAERLQHSYHSWLQRWCWRLELH